MEVKIRQAKEGDWQIIQRLNTEVFENSLQFDKYLNVKDPFSPESIKNYKKTVTDKDIFCVIAEINGVPAGYLVGSENNYSYRINRRAEVSHMGVSLKFRAQGVGSKLILEFKNWCRKKGITHFAANTYFQDNKARHFYEKNGMSPIDVTLEGSVG